jgi:cellulose synthase/poly-beta-1,6-N-acetylglucosamine synthase-like glycosyltransferase
MKKYQPSITVMFPFLNDWGTVGSLVGLAIATVTQITDDWEVVIVNDGSRKEDREALEMIINFINSRGPATRQPQSPPTRGSRLWGSPPRVTPNRIRVINHEKNRGYGGALRSGFAAAKKEFIFYTDCDAQYDPRELSRLWEKMNTKVGMVNGYKIKRHDPLHRVIAGRLYHYFVKFLFQLPIRDTDCDFRLIRRKVFNPSPPAGGSGHGAVRLFENTGTICLELVKKIDHAGYKIVEVPVHHYWRTSGKSQFFNFGRLFSTGINLCKVWWKLMVKQNYAD